MTLQNRGGFLILSTICVTTLSGSQLSEFQLITKFKTFRISVPTLISFKEKGCVYPLKCAINTGNIGVSALL